MTQLRPSGPKRHEFKMPSVFWKLSEQRKVAEP